MVLEDSSASIRPPSFEDAPPASDQDHYSSASTDASSGEINELMHRIDVSSFPKPIPILGPLMGYNETLYNKVLLQKLKMTQKQYLKRPLTFDEANAYSYWTAKQISIFSYGAPIGIAGGLYRTYATAGTFRFPFWQPNLETMQTQVYPHPKMPLLTGQRAVMAWHALRMVAYGSVGNYIGQIIFGSYSMSVAAVGELSDPRLKDVIAAVRKASNKARGSLPASTPVSTNNRKGEEQDDASPTGIEYRGEDHNGSGSLDGLASSSRPGDISTRQPVQFERTPPQSQPEPERSFPGFDDASPTAGQEVDTSQQSGSAWDRVRSGRVDPRRQQRQSSSRSNIEADDASPSAGAGLDAGASQGSAWDRLRSGQAVDKRKSGWKTGKGPGETSWNKVRNNESMEGSEDTSSFSNAQEDRSLAKIQAQKEFDAQVDRERHGGEFSSRRS